MPGNNCCHRIISTILKPKPVDQDDDYANLLLGSIDSPLIKQTVHSHCPSIEFIAPHSSNLWMADYWMEGAVTANRVTGKTKREYNGDESGRQNYGGDLTGDFTFTLTLSDPHHDNVIKEAYTSWIGRYRDFASPSNNVITSMVEREFGNLAQILLDYEKMPVTGQINPAKDVVDLEEIIDVKIENLNDYNRQPPQPFQRILIKADYGEILEGVVAGEFKVFNPQGSSIKFRYKAPDNCNNGASDTITFFNSCMIDDNIEPLYLTRPDYKIATKTIKLNCLELEFQHHYIITLMTHRQDIRVVGTVPLFLSDEGGTPTINGTGVLKFSYRASDPVGRFTASGDGTLKAVIGGKLEKDESSGEPVLKLDIDESWEVKAIVTFSTPYMSWSQIYEYTPRHDRGYPFPVIDGYTMEHKGPVFPGFQGGPKIILHLKKK